MPASIWRPPSRSSSFLASTPTKISNCGEQAIDQYKEVLERDPKNINSVKGIAYLYLQMKRFDDAKDFLPQGLAIDPNDPSPTTRSP